MEPNIKDVLDSLFEDLKPAFEMLWSQLPSEYKNLAESSFKLIVKLSKDLIVAKVSGNQNDISRVSTSLNHTISALLSTIISGISKLEDPFKQITMNLALNVFSTLITRLFSLLK